MARLLLKGGRIIDPASGYDSIGDILIDNSKISAMGASVDDPKAKTVLCQGMIVAPGFIDMHVHVREPGREDEETIASGAKAAAAGGITAIAVMPNTCPVADNRSVIDFIQGRAAESACVRVFPIGAISVGLQGENLAEMADMAEAGAAAFSDDGSCVMNSDLMRRALEYVKMLDKTLIVHAEDKDLAKNGHMNEGFYSTVLGIPGIPVEAETTIIGRDIALAKMTKSRVHFAHVSCRDSIKMIAAAKAEGLFVTAEATPHHLLLTEESLVDYDSNYKMNPPLRSTEDRDALVEALGSGIIDIVASDHAPHARQEKELEFCRAPFGVIGLESTVPLMLSEFVSKGSIDLVRFVESMTVKPADLLGLNEYGRLKVGGPADLTVLDMNFKHCLYEDSDGRDIFNSRSKNTPFKGREAVGAAVMTIVGGEIVYQLNTIKAG